jgi:flavin reductase (DIM6/NTAB) family NADH-FMN oxidoreductase RutF
MSRFPTGVTVVAAMGPQGLPFGLTVNSFTSVSLDPPLVLVCIDRGAASHDPLMDAPHFTVNVLASGQSDVASRFASEPTQGRFDAVVWHESTHGAPLVEGASAWLECSLHAMHEAGDHTILVGRVQSADAREGSALVFHRGRYGSTGE